MNALFANRYVKFICLLIIAYGCFEGFLLWKQRNDGFSVENIYSRLPNSPKWHIPTTSEKLQEVRQILAQPFYYIGHGFQFYAFESGDQKYVLKFMRHQRLHPPVMYDWMPDCSLVRDLKDKKAQKRADRVNILFESLKIAYQDIPEQTGLVFVQLNKLKNLQTFGQAFIVDLLDNEYRIELDDTEFVLQYKATFVKPTLKALMKSGKLDEAKERIDQLFTLLKETAKKGILDEDGALVRKNNVGFLDDRAIYIDTGRFVYKESINTAERFADDLRRLRPLQKWLLAHYPPLAAHFDKQQRKVLQSF